ncbi:hypothetical protein [Criblamydia sequanensis]|uniref:Secreted protein n=1 Tax=Candidatus Criblamydia sequanensis CRIB-18 TaxID=1437425 RepID=A0A090D1P3_9BACT|nr:hypothetical protein [Criblamydia sequanensis]CDR33955.1 hypothetical protein CSEC_1129 [Criblamydia sequanensis CRIB-18]
MLKFFLLAASCLSFTFLMADDLPPNLDTKEIGRYQLTTVVVDKMHDIRHYLLDTRTGQVWESKLHWMERESWKPYLLPPASSEAVSK